MKGESTQTLALFRKEKGFFGMHGVCNSAGMKEPIIRNVQDIDDADRRVLEHVLGQKLRKNQQVMIRVVSLGPEVPVTHESAPETGATLPVWCKVYDGLTDEQIADLETVVLQRADLTHP